MPSDRTLHNEKLFLGHLQNHSHSTTSENFKVREDPPINRHRKVFFFNLTNAEAVFGGKEKPKLVEVGPYTYTEKWTKQNITWHKNGTLSYRTRKIFT
jgi:scavenger receptor class B protein 1